jgi:hypothetical protein
MPRTANASDGVSVKITVSKQSADLLSRIATMGIYGRNQSDVAARFVDKALESFVDPPRLNLGGGGESKAGAQ